MMLSAITIIVIWFSGVALFAGRPFFRGKQMLLPLLGLFWLTAVFAAIISHDSDRALAKLALLTAGCFLYLVFIQLPARHLHRLYLLLGGVGGGVAVYFLLTNSWRQWPADVWIVQRVGMWLMWNRPSVDWPAMHPNFAGGIIAVFAPLLVARAWLGWRQRLWRRLAGTCAVGVVAAFGLLLTSSRAALISLLVAFGLWGVGELFEWLRRVHPRFPLIGWGTTAVLVAVAVVGTLIVGLNPVRFGQLLPGMDSTGSRLFLIRETLHLIGDFPLFGAGLVSFPGIFSQYTMVIPSFFFDYSHNLYLDVLFEQGAVGFVAFLLLIGVSGGRLFWQLIQYQQPLAQRIRNWGIVAGLATLLMHGLIDDALYGGLGTPLLFVLPGLATVATQTKAKGWVMEKRPFTLLFSIVSLAAAASVTLLFQPLQQLAQTNWQNVAFARVQLIDWPQDRWTWGENIEAYAPFELEYRDLLTAEPDNRSALHRLGFLAMNKGDYETAVFYLQQAHELDPDHRGIRKLLGYSYAWLGKPGLARQQLVFISESRRELFQYVSWWEAQGREDLAAASQETAVRLR